MGNARLLKEGAVVMPESTNVMNSSKSPRVLEGGDEVTSQTISNMTLDKFEG